MGTRTKNLDLYKPAPTDYVNVETDLNENFDKVDEKVLLKGTYQGKAQDLKNEIDEKQDKTDNALETNNKKITGAINENKKNIDKQDMLLIANSGLPYDPNLIHLNNSGVKKEGYFYLDKNKLGLFKCKKQTESTVNSTEFFEDISNNTLSYRMKNDYVWSDIALFGVIYDQKDQVVTFDFKDWYNYLDVYGTQSGFIRLLIDDLKSIKSSGKEVYIQIDNDYEDTYTKVRVSRDNKVTLTCHAGSRNYHQMYIYRCIYSYKHI